MGSTGGQSDDLLDTPPVAARRVTEGGARDAPRLGQEPKGEETQVGVSQHPSLLFLIPL